MIKFYIVFVILSLSLNAYGTEIKKLPRKSSWSQKDVKLPEPCDLKLNFGSYGSGRNHKVYKKIQNYVQGSKKITTAYQWSWGLEGEVSMCLKLTSGQIQQVYKDLKGFIPKTSKTGPTSIETLKGKKFSSQYP